MIITIDGPAASGKSTIAKLVAKKLNFLHFNSGSLFRGITAYLFYSEYNFNLLNKATKFNDINLEIKYINNCQHVFVNGKDYYNNLRENQISILTPKVSENLDLRNIIDNCQKSFCSNNNVVVEGRDAGSYVFPNAEVKIYLDCDIKVRAKRRFDQIKDKNTNITLEEIEKQIHERDEFDKNKTIAPFKIPKDAIIVDSSTLNIDETIDEIFKHIKIQ